MNWQITLRKLEKKKQWDTAIEFMEIIIADNPNDMDAYIAMNYLMMNLLVEEKHDCSKHDDYYKLTKKYFDESYAKFSENAEYLFYTAVTAVFSEWYFGIEVEDYEAMFEKARHLEPNNEIYKINYYSHIAREDPANKEAFLQAKKFLDKDYYIYKTLVQKGAVGEYLLDVYGNCAKKTIENYEKINKITQN